MENENNIFTLQDENGKETDFEAIDICEKDGRTFYALVPVKEEEKIVHEEEGQTFEEYIILELIQDETGEYSLETVDDDEIWEDVADYFDDRMTEEIDYDEK